MKKHLLFALATIVFAGCSTNATQDLAPEAPTTLDVLYVSFDEEDTRIQLGEDGRPVWTEGDLVSVFYRSNSNDKYLFTGKTGDMEGSIELVEEGIATQETTKIIAIYPYNKDYGFDCKTYDIKAFLPAEQMYCKNSYGVGSSIMIAQSDYKQLSFKNVCGWLKLQFTGKGYVSKIALKGNNGEQVAGRIYIHTQNATDSFAATCEDLYRVEGEWDDDENIGAPIAENPIITEVVLNCGGNIALNSETPTSFYIALPPQCFEQGITVTMYDENGFAKRVSTKNTITIKRNHITPMASLDIEMPMVNNQMDYADGGTMW